jgi:hypothetical protein
MTQPMGSTNMSTIVFDSTPDSRSQRVREIRSRWSLPMRLQRAIQGHKRLQELVGLIDQAAPEIWAVGAPAPADLSRIRNSR